MPNGRPDPAHTAPVRGSFAPPEPIHRLRDLTRARTRLTAERSGEVRRLERFLEDTGIKPSSVAGDIMGVSVRAMPEALIAGVDDPGGPPDPAVPADPAKRRLRNKIPALVEALTGRFTEHHAFPVRLHPDRIDRLTAALDALAARIEAQVRALPPAVDPPTTIPGVDRHIAEVIVAETGGDMTVLPAPIIQLPGPTWHMPTHQVHHNDLGGDHHTR
jgi:transposase